MQLMDHHVIKRVAIGTGIVAASIAYFAGTLFGLNLPLAIAIGIYAFIAFLCVAPRLLSKTVNNEAPKKGDEFHHEAPVLESIELGRTLTNLISMCEGCGFPLTSTMKTCPNCNERNPIYRKSVID